MSHEKVVSLYKSFSNHAENTLAIAGGFDSLISQYFNPADGIKFKTNLNIAIATVMNAQPDALNECLKTPILRAKVCNSIMKIIQLGAVVDYRYIYFSKFGGKTPDAGFNLQYQAEIKILEQNGYCDIETGYVLQGEKNNIENALGGLSFKHIPNMENRMKSASEIIENVLFGYAMYTNKNVRKLFIVDNDILQASYKMSNDKSDRAGKTNLKWNFKKAIDISIIHSLFKNLVLKDWESEEYEYQDSIKEIIPKTQIDPCEAFDIDPSEIGNPAETTTNVVTENKENPNNNE